MASKGWQLRIGVVLLAAVVGGVLFLGGKAALSGGSETPAQLWIAGAAALGLLSGLVTGLSTNAGSGMQFVAFIGTGIVVPVLGGAGALLARSQEVVERTKYSGTQVVEKSTLTSTFYSSVSLHPMAVLGSFFLAFGIAAILGVISGGLLRNSNATDVRAAPGQ